MINFRDFTKEYIYVDGVKELQKKFLEAANCAIEISVKHIEKSEKFVEGYTNKEVGKIINNPYELFIDFCEEQPENALKGYFVLEHKIHRFLIFTIDIALLFPQTNHYNFTNESHNGLCYSEIENLRNRQAKIIIQFYFGLDDKKNLVCRKRTIDFCQRRALHTLKRMGYIYELYDDIGEPFTIPKEVDKLKIIDFPTHLKKTYNMVATFAPYTQKECYCALFAEDNEAIKVLRWFPKNRAEVIKKRNIELWYKMVAEHLNTIDYEGKDKYVKINEQCKKEFGLEEFAGDTFFELGCVNDINVKELYDFMIKNNSRILFAKIEDLEINILGGVKLFIESEFSYPLCLSNIEIL